MNASQATFTMLLLFALRCLLPLVLIFGIGYAMNWMVNRWEAEAAAEFDRGTAVPAEAAGKCWAFKRCNPERRQNCPGFKERMVPCWLARTRVEGILPDECIGCPLYKQAPSFA